MSDDTEATSEATPESTLESRWAPTLGHITVPEVHAPTPATELPAEPAAQLPDPVTPDEAQKRLEQLLDTVPTPTTPDVVLGATAEVPSAQLDSTIGNFPSITMNGGNLYWGGAGVPTPAPSWTLPGSHYFQISDRTMPLPVPEQPEQTAAASVAEPAKAFVSDVAGKTIITAPARTIAKMREPSIEDITAAHMLWMHGKFVGAEVPNRNGAFWSAGDLEMARGTVTNGPLNWLHDARHVIGTLAQADYVAPAPAGGLTAAAADAAGTSQPHITATAAIWKWIYPDEAYVIQQASEQEMLWYSMECISREVSCVGDSGCGNTVSYAEYMAGAACEHIVQRASVRRFKDPVFLGGAVIVPPTRPGWAEADARVMVDDSMAEAAFEQAGQPDIAASDWESLMAQVITFARG